MSADVTPLQILNTTVLQTATKNETSLHSCGWCDMSSNSYYDSVANSDQKCDFYALVPTV